MKLKSGVSAMLAAVLVLSVAARAGESMGTPAARRLFNEGEAARKAHHYAKAVEKFRKAIELDPDYAEAHSSFIFNSESVAMGLTKSGLPKPPANETPAQKEEREKREKERIQQAKEQVRAQYESWASAYPDKAVYQWALGHLYDYEDRKKAESYYRKAVELDPRFARAYQSLSLLAELRGDDLASRDLLKKAAESNPDDPQYLFYYTQKLRDDRAAYLRSTEDLVARFPAHDRSAQALYWFAETADDQAEKLATLERLRTAFPPQKFGWSADGMTILFDLYMAADSAQALALAQQMAKAAPKDKDWQALSLYAKNAIQARSLLAENKSAEAVALMDATTIPRYLNQTGLNLLKADVFDAAGQTPKAYETLSKLMAAEPRDEIGAALARYAAKISKSASDTDSDLWKLRDAKATLPTEFSLSLYTEDRKVSLADYKGKVVLLNFWYPG
jgi:Flp pilus assembly protein TadD